VCSDPHGLPLTNVPVMCGPELGSHKPVYFGLVYLDHILNAIYPSTFLRRITVTDLGVKYSTRCGLLPAHALINTLACLVGFSQLFKVHGVKLP
jgi:hypothetical protein